MMERQKFEPQFIPFTMLSIHDIAHHKYGRNISNKNINIFQVRLPQKQETDTKSEQNTKRKQKKTKCFLRST